MRTAPPGIIMAAPSFLRPFALEEFSESSHGVGPGCRLPGFFTSGSPVGTISCSRFSVDRCLCNRLVFGCGVKGIKRQLVISEGPDSLHGFHHGLVAKRREICSESTSFKPNLGPCVRPLYECRCAAQNRARSADASRLRRSRPRALRRFPQLRRSARRFWSALLPRHLLQYMPDHVTHSPWRSAETL